MDQDILLTVSSHHVCGRGLCGVMFRWLITSWWLITTSQLLQVLALKWLEAPDDLINVDV